MSKVVVTGEFIKLLLNPIPRFTEIFDISGKNSDLALFCSINGLSLMIVIMGIIIPIKV